MVIKTLQKIPTNCSAFYLETRFGPKCHLQLLKSIKLYSH